MRAAIGRPRVVVAGVTLALAALAAVGSEPARAVPGCDRYAGPTGSDLSPGTEALPFKTVRRLVEALASGETGCLRAGSYVGPDNGAAVPSPLYLDAPGSTLRSYPGESASVDARLEVTGAGASITNLTLDAATLNTTVTPLKLVGDGAVFSHSRLTGHDRIGTCLQVGTGNAKPSGIIVEHNEIYGCGADDAGANKFDHNIYVTHARGTIIRWNVLRDNPGGWGVHLYPDADGTLVEHNDIESDHGGVVFAGDGSGATSDDNEVRFNSLTYPDSGGGTPRYNLEGSWSGGPPGTGNTAHHNCVHSAGAGSPSGIQDPPSGFTASGNVVLSGGSTVDGVADQQRLWAHNPCAVAVGPLAGR